MNWGQDKEKQCEERSLLSVLVRKILLCLEDNPSPEEKDLIQALWVVSAFPGCRDGPTVHNWVHFCVCLLGLLQSAFSFKPWLVLYPVGIVLFELFWSAQNRKLNTTELVCKTQWCALAALCWPRVADQADRRSGFGPIYCYNSSWRQKEHIVLCAVMDLGFYAPADASWVKLFPHWWTVIQLRAACRREKHSLNTHKAAEALLTAFICQQPNSTEIMCVSIRLSMWVFGSPSPVVGLQNFGGTRMLLKSHHLLEHNTCWQPKDSSLLDWKGSLNWECQPMVFCIFSHNDSIFLLILWWIAVCEFASLGVIHPWMNVTGVPGLFLCVCNF